MQRESGQLLLPIQILKCVLNVQSSSNRPKECFGRSWEGSQDNSSQYLRSSCCLLVWHLTVWWFFWRSYFHRGVPPYIHFNLTTRILIYPHKVVTVEMGVEYEYILTCHTVIGSPYHAIIWLATPLVHVLSLAWLVAGKELCMMCTWSPHDHIVIVRREAGGVNYTQRLIPKGSQTS